jgi:AcrR family transcriptional regulator
VPRVVDVEQRRAELTDAAARVIARSGIEAATMREVAAEAGWTTGALTHYFGDKRELLLATFHASLAHRRALRPSADASPIERLTASLIGALPLDEARRRHWLVTLTCCTQASGDRQLAVAQRDAYREFRDHVTALVGEADLCDPATARPMAERLIAVADGVAIQALFDPAGWPPQRQVEVLEATVASISSALDPTGGFV